MKTFDKNKYMFASKLSDTSDVMHHCQWSGRISKNHKNCYCWYNKAAATQTSKMIRCRNNARDVPKSLQIYKCQQQCFIPFYPILPMCYLYTCAIGENNLVLQKPATSDSSYHHTLSTWHCWPPVIRSTNDFVICGQRWVRYSMTQYHFKYGKKWHCEQEFISRPTQTASQQQPNDDCWLTGVLELILMLVRGSAADDAAGPTRDLISAAIVTNACSTLVAFFALVSRKGMRSWSAYSCRCQNTRHALKFRLQWFTTNLK